MTPTCSLAQPLLFMINPQLPPPRIHHLLPLTTPSPHSSFPAPLPVRCLFALPPFPSESPNPLLGPHPLPPMRLAVRPCSRVPAGARRVWVIVRLGPPATRTGLCRLTGVAKILLGPCSAGQARLTCVQSGCAGVCYAA